MQRPFSFQKHSSLPKIYFYIFWTVFCTPIAAQTIDGIWYSTLAQTHLEYKITTPKQAVRDYNGNIVTIVYLEELGFKKLGKNKITEDVSWLLQEGYRLIEIKYKHHKKAISPYINTDIIAINNQLASGEFCGLTNCSNYKSYILFEGYRIKRDVPYFKDNPKIYNRPEQYTEGDDLNMDIIYPSNAPKQVPVILSFSYSNSYATFNKDSQQLTAANKNQRVNLNYTFAGFNDSFLEGAPANGMAWAIADHPKYCSWGSGKPENGKNDTYKSYETNPDTAQKVKSAIRTLRSLGADLDLSDRIGIYGFSRGSTAGSMAIGDRKVSEFESNGFHLSVDDDVQAAALGPGVFDYTIIYDTTNDGDENLELRCPWAWGELKDHHSYWKTMGSEYLVETKATAPVLFFYNEDDSPYYMKQVAHLKQKLDALHIPNTTIKNYGTGHAVPQTEAPLKSMYTFFKTYLKPPKV